MTARYAAWLDAIDYRGTIGSCRVFAGDPKVVVPAAGRRHRRGARLRLFRRSHRQCRRQGRLVGLAIQPGDPRRPGNLRVRVSWLGRQGRRGQQAERAAPSHNRAREWVLTARQQDLLVRAEMAVPVRRPDGRPHQRGHPREPSSGRRTKHHANLRPGHGQGRQRLPAQPLRGGRDSGRPLPGRPRPESEVAGTGRRALSRLRFHAGVAGIPGGAHRFLQPDHQRVRGRDLPRRIECRLQDC